MYLVLFVVTSPNAEEFRLQNLTSHSAVKADLNDKAILPHLQGFVDFLFPKRFVYARNNVVTL